MSKFDLREINESQLISIGVSEKTAKEIITFRNQQPFVAKSDLKKVPSVDNTLYDSIKSRIILPRVKKTEGEGASLLNLNKVSLEELLKISNVKGFNEKIATQIIQYRDQNGNFETLSQLKKVNGIGPVLFSSLEPLFTINIQSDNKPKKKLSTSHVVSAVNNNNDGNDDSTKKKSNKKCETLSCNENNDNISSPSSSKESIKKSSKKKPSIGGDIAVINENPTPIIPTNRVAPRNLKIASWNLRNFSEKSAKRRFSKVALLLSNFHLIALQEIKSLIAIQKLLTDYPDDLGNYKLEVSNEAVGRNNVTEWYGFLWDDTKVEMIDTRMVDDPDNLMSRPPYLGTFQSGSFLFTLVNVHVIYGTMEERELELRYLASIVKTVIIKSKKFNTDVLLLGDFNNPPSNPNWRFLATLGFGYTACLKGEHLSSTIAISDQGNLYDNIWYSEMYTGRNYTGEAKIFDVLTFFGVNDKNSEDIQNFKAEVSDHKPIYAEFRTDIEEDTTVTTEKCKLGKIVLKKE